MTVEAGVALLTASTTDLVNAVGAQQIVVVDAVAAFNAITNRVTNELDLVDNTSDKDKPVSDAVTTLLALKQATLVSGDNISTVNGESILTGAPLVIARGQVEIPAITYETRASLRTPVTPIPITGDVVNIRHLGHFQFSSLLEFIDDDEMVIESVSPADGVTPVGQWVMTLPAYEWTEAQKMFEYATIWEWMEDEELRWSKYDDHHNEV